MDDLLQQGIAAYKAGKHDEARKIFIALVKQTPNNERAWGWMYAVANDDKERIYCMKQALRINPSNEKAKQILDSLTGQNFPFDTPQSPPVPTQAQKSSTPSQISFANFETVLKLSAVVLTIALFIFGVYWISSSVSLETLYGHPVGYSWNNLGTINQGGVNVKVARLAVFEKSSISKKDQETYSNAYYGLDTICDLYFEITNNTDRIMSLYVDQGLVMVNDEQVQLKSFMFDTKGTLGGELLPGATVTGVITFGLKRITPDTINNITITFTAPHDQYFNSYGQDYVFYLDLSHHEWVNKPDYLK
jgi:hypothetical protein